MIQLGFQHKIEEVGGKAGELCLHGGCHGQPAYIIPHNAQTSTGPWAGRVGPPVGRSIKRVDHN
jgi:hypothetical protein